VVHVLKSGRILTQAQVEMFPANPVFVNIFGETLIIVNLICGFIFVSIALTNRWLSPFLAGISRWFLKTALVG